MHTEGTASFCSFWDVVALGGEEDSIAGMFPAIWLRTADVSQRMRLEIGGMRMSGGCRRVMVESMVRNDAARVSLGSLHGIR